MAQLMTSIAAISIFPFAARGIMEVLFEKSRLLIWLFVKALLPMESSSVHFERSILKMELCLLIHTMLMCPDLMLKPCGILRINMGKNNEEKIVFFWGNLSFLIRMKKFSPIFHI